MFLSIPLDEKRKLINRFRGASNQIGQLESGLTAAWLGTVPAIVLGGLGTLMVVAIWSWRFPEIRRLQSGTELQL
jgi:hypothetical protein